MKRTVIILFLFIIVQMIIGTLATLGIQAIGVDWKQSTSVLVASALSNVLLIAIVWLTKWHEPRREHVRNVSKLVLMWSVVLGLGMILPLTWMEEFIPAAWRIDTTQGMLAEMLQTTEGYFVICMLAPLAEEIVFRGAIIKALMAWGRERRDKVLAQTGAATSPLTDGKIAWTAIIISAVVFGLAHMNPAQIPHALIVGVLLGWLYVKTGSIIPGFLVHWINNSFAYVSVKMFPLLPVDAPLADYFGGDTTNLYKALGFSLLIALPALYQLIMLLKNRKPAI